MRRPICQTSKLMVHRANSWGNILNQITTFFPVALLHIWWQIDAFFSNIPMPIFDLQTLNQFHSDHLPVVFSVNHKHLYNKILEWIARNPIRNLLFFLNDSFDDQRSHVCTKENVLMSRKFPKSNFLSFPTHIQNINMFRKYYRRQWNRHRQ